MAQANSKSKRKKLAISTLDFTGWAGGLDYVRNLMRCIEYADPDNQIDKYVLIPRNDLNFNSKRLIKSLRSSIKVFLRSKRISWVTSSVFDQLYLEKFFDELTQFKVHLIGSSGRRQRQFMANNCYDKILPVFKGFDTKQSENKIGYIYDFQHKYLPDFFSNEEASRRNRYFQQIADNASMIIVNSQAVADDIYSFYPTSGAKVIVAPFCPCPEERWFDDYGDLECKYGLQKPFFIISNQFWSHKNFKVVFSAFKRMKDEGNCALPQLVCTGSTFNEIDPNYFPNLKRYIEAHDLFNDIKILGFIDKMDQIQLMRKSIGVIQPSLFEGGPGGGSGYEALALGKPLILSDIPVNREIKGFENCYFFSADNPNDLKDNLLRVAKQEMEYVDPKVLIQRGKILRQKCGAHILEALAIKAEN